MKRLAGVVEEFVFGHSRSRLPSASLNDSLKYTDSKTTQEIQVYVAP